MVEHFPSNFGFFFFFFFTFLACTDTIHSLLVFQAFASFARAACRRALVAASASEAEAAAQMPSDTELHEVFEQYAGTHKEVLALYALRTLLGAVIETLIVCDRALYLDEALAPSETKRVAVHAIFDPQLSPRNFAVCAIR